jgi:DNA-binding NarL/FixJ family response regulator
MPAIGVVIADDDVLLREGLASLLSRPPFEILGLAGDATELLQLVETRMPGLVVLDIRMPPSHTTEGIDAARTIRARFPDIAILVLSAHVDIERGLDLLAGGRGMGYLLKSRVTQVGEFIETLERVAAGATVIDPGLVQELVASRHAVDPLSELTAREREVLQRMAEGRSNAGIARVLWVTEGTVEKHVRSILSKLDLPDTTDENRRVLAVLKFLEAKSV